MALESREGRTFSRIIDDEAQNLIRLSRLRKRGPHFAKISEAHFELKFSDFWQFFAKLGWLFTVYPPIKFYFTNLKVLTALTIFPWNQFCFLRSAFFRYPFHEKYEFRVFEARNLFEKDHGISTKLRFVYNYHWGTQSESWRVRHETFVKRLTWGITSS